MGGTALSHVFYRNFHNKYPEISHGHRVYLWDSGGNRYFDGASGALVANLGHGRKDIAEVICAQVEKVAFAHTMRFTSAPLERLGRNINAVLQGEGWYVYPTSGGSEAVETAIKLSRQVQLERGHPERYRILTRRSSYHGNSIGALSASGHASRRQPYGPLLSDAFILVDAPKAHCPGLGTGEPCDCVAPFLAAIDQYGAESIAAMMVEPIGGSARSGFVPHEGYLKSLREIADRYGIILIFDEVMSGFGRTGKVLAADYEGVLPDIVVVAKGLSGGYAPLGAVIANEDIYQAIRAGSGHFVHGFTYSGNPVAAAVGARVIEILQEEGLIDNAAVQGVALRRGLEELCDRYPWISTIRGRGLMQGILFAPIPGLAKLVVDTAWEHGCILYLGSGETEGGDGEHLLAAPPLIINDTEMGEFLDLIAEVLAVVDRRIST
ncbi:Aspartate aminotransferase family protein [Kyrpidia spormannii]|uniref:Aminotransferase class-III n=2 Tax=Kyrpidia spormannii TaxID=2055160 RepID=A0ACA8Z7W4_9BACL|nr:Aminotransferase class-III [Kyrpidia spormannii]CAB3391568.1 Aspartate aminotransferase family protein [Kyrpidia spormannii]